MLKLAFFGCGSRARGYADIAMAMNGRYACVAGADPIPERVDYIRDVSKNEHFRGFNSGEELLKQPKLADVLVIGTQDDYHFEPAKKALEKGYDLLLEKPAAQTAEEVQELVALAKKLDRRIMLCFVLRYTSFYQKVKEILDGEKLGELVSVHSCEGVEPFHQAHSFVRGHWNRAENSTPMIVAKCSHDLDILSWLIGSPCRAVSSFGGIHYFKKEKEPAGATSYCLEGCPHQGSCAYDAEQYLGAKQGWLKMVFPDPRRLEECLGQEGNQERDQEHVRSWLKYSPWGRCVFSCDNDVVDHQVVNMEFSNGVTASHTMTAFDQGRTLELFGTKAMLRGGDAIKAQFGCDFILKKHHVEGEEAYEKIVLEENNTMGYAGHGGGDYGLMNALDQVMQGPKQLEHLIECSQEGHLIGFLAEESRNKGGECLSMEPSF